MKWKRDITKTPSTTPATTKTTTLRFLVFLPAQITQQNIKELARSEKIVSLHCIILGACVLLVVFICSNEFECSNMRCCCRCRHKVYMHIENDFYLCDILFPKLLLKKIFIVLRWILHCTAAEMLPMQERFHLFWLLLFFAHFQFLVFCFVFAFSSYSQNYLYLFT